MKIIDSYLIKDSNGKMQVLYSCSDNPNSLIPNRYFVSTNGAFGQRELYIEEITEDIFNTLNK